MAEMDRDSRRVGPSTSRPPPAPGSTRSLLLTVLAELVLPMDEPVWTASLLYVLTGLGVAASAARQAIARSADAGWIRGEKVGREVRWRVTDIGTALIDDITRRVLSLSDPPQWWDGQCLILMVSVSQENRTVRKPLYTALGWAGFGNPAPGLWASPHVDRLAETKRVIDELGLRDSTIAFVGTTERIGLTDREIVQRAWQLDEVAERYKQLIARFEGARPRPGDELLFAHLSLIDEWTRFPYMDPQLPQDLLPDWIDRRASALFVDLYRQWTPMAQDRWLEVVRATSPVITPGPSPVVR